jgi:hypothetical protein
MTTMRRRVGAVRMVLTRVGRAGRAPSDQAEPRSAGGAAMEYTLQRNLRCAQPA